MRISQLVWMIMSIGRQCAGVGRRAALAHAAKHQGAREVKLPCVVITMGKDDGLVHEEPEPKLAVARRPGRGAAGPQPCSDSIFISIN